MCQLAELQVDQHMALEDAVVENKVKVEVLVLIPHELLPGDKAKAPTKLQQKFLQLIDQRLLQIGFPQRRIVFQIEEIQHIGAFDEILGGKRLHQFVRLFYNGSFIPAGQQAVIVQRGNLPFQLTARPACANALLHIPVSRGVVFDAQQSAVVRPCQLRTQCVRIWKHGIKLFHLLKISHIKAFSELIRQPLGQVLQHAFPVFSTKASVLLVLHDDASDVPVCLNHREVDRAVGLTARQQKRFFDL